MVENSVTKYLIDFLKTCPHLRHKQSKRKPVVTFNSMGKAVLQYNLSILPSEQTITLYRDGSERKRCYFSLQSREGTIEEIARVETSALYEQVTQWLKEQSRTGLPPLENCQPVKIRAITWGSVETDTDSTGNAVYQIDCDFEYFHNQKGTY